MVFWALLIATISISTTDCYPSSLAFWNLHGNYETNQTNIYFLNEDDSSIESQSYLEYTSKRHRKKWMLSLCGNFEDSTLNFTSNKDLKGIDLSEYVSIQIKKSLDKTIFNNFDIKLIQNGNILKEASARYSNKAPSCFSIIYGRGFFGLFSMKNVHKQEGDQILASQIEVPRNHIFRYYSRKPSNVTYLCVGDYFGNKRLSVKPENDQWNPHIRDFL